MSSQQLMSESAKEGLPLVAQTVWAGLSDQSVVELNARRRRRFWMEFALFGGAGAFALVAAVVGISL